MAANSIPLLALLHKAGRGFSRRSHSGALPSHHRVQSYEQDRRSAVSEGRITHRNGYRDRVWDTRAGTVAPQIPPLTCAKARSSQSSLSRAADPSAPCSSWFRKPMPTASILVRLATLSSLRHDRCKRERGLTDLQRA